MSTTKAKSLREIRKRVDLMPGTVYCVRDADICINELCNALVELVEYIKEKETCDANRTPEAD